MAGRDGHEVLWLQDVAARDAGVSGGKGANLAAMAAVGLPVPPGFVVPTATYRGVAAEAGLALLIETVLPGLDVTDPEALAAASERLRPVVETAPVPEDARASITTAYDALGGGRVAVRSSATAEDLPEASFAGQQETVLDVEGFDAVVDAVRRCWSSPWTARAIAYRARNRIPHQRVAVAVVVQRMVPAQVAGVLFTADPVTGIRHHVVVEATAGLGEPLVGGRVVPWRWRVDSSTRTVLEVPVGGEPLLDRARLMVLVDLGVRAAALFRSPQDVEWATSNGRCWLLQSRPITSLFPVPSPAPAPEAGLRVYVPVLLVGQGIAAPLTPSGTAFFRALLAAYADATDPLRRWHRRPATASTGRPGWAPIARGRLFVDVTPILRAPRVRTLLVRRSALRDPIESAVLREWLERNGDRLSDARVSVELLVHGLSFAAQYVARVPSALVVPERARRRALRRGADALSDLRRRADELRTVEERIEFVDREMPLPVLMFVFDQVPPVLAG
ncbi:MAG TPA: PEP/pyruvate-binding domain-containing protein, partial [Mycobacteriales bacterium]|nr:PEP/pyruvate-binding domain-containing protein [Mycobacteriales bacterium]